MINLEQDLLFFIKINTHNFEPNETKNISDGIKKKLDTIDRYNWFPIKRLLFGWSTVLKAEKEKNKNVLYVCAK